MIPDFSTRSTRSELMDDPEIDATRLAKTLDDLARVNKYTAGHAVTIAGVEDLVDDRRKGLSILDVGTGGGDVPRRLARWATRKQIDLYVRGIDLSAPTVEHARRQSLAFPNIEFQRQDLFALSANEGFDIVHAALMLHHLSDEEAIAGLKKMYEVSNLGVVINDLHRHPIGYYGSRVLLPILSRNPMIRHDGSLSILRAFTRTELYSLTERAGLPKPEIRWRPLFRWQMILRRENP